MQRQAEHLERFSLFSLKQSMLSCSLCLSVLALVCSVIGLKYAAPESFSEESNRISQ